MHIGIWVAKFGYFIIRKTLRSTLGSMRAQVSNISYGVMTFGHQNDLKQAKELLTAAREGGINL